MKNASERKFIIVTDSCSDLSKAQREKYGVEYLPMGVTFRGNSYKADLDFIEYSPEDICEVLKSGERVFTSQVNEDVFEDYFNKCAASNLDVMYISCSSMLSGSINMAINARKKVLEAHPEMKISCIDSLSSTLGEGLMVCMAADKQKKGMSIDEVEKWVEDNKQRFNSWMTVGNLTYLKRAGRVSGMTAIMGNLLNIKPIIIADSIGQNLSIAKIKGRKKAIAYLIDMTEKTISKESNMLFIAHALVEEDAEYIKNELLSRLESKGYKFDDVYINIMGPILTACAGPDSLAICSLGDSSRKDFEPVKD